MFARGESRAANASGLYLVPSIPDSLSLQPVRRFLVFASFSLRAGLTSFVRAAPVLARALPKAPRRCGDADAAVTSTRLLGPHPLQCGTRLGGRSALQRARRQSRPQSSCSLGDGAASRHRAQRSWSSYRYHNAVPRLVVVAFAQRLCWDARRESATAKFWCALVREGFERLAPIFAEQAALVELSFEFEPLFER